MDQNADSIEDIRPLHLLGIAMTSASLRLTVPWHHKPDLEKLLRLENQGFIPPGTVKPDADEQAFVLELDGAKVSHLLELLDIAIDDRHAETWSERQSREIAQMRLNLAGGP